MSRTQTLVTVLVASLVIVISWWLLQGKSVDSQGRPASPHEFHLRDPELQGMSETAQEDGDLRMPVNTDKASIIVRDSMDERPVPGATVLVREAIAKQAGFEFGGKPGAGSTVIVTNADGRGYVGVSGKHYVAISADGYIPWVGTLELAGARTVVGLEPAAELTLKYETIDHVPLPGIDVFLNESVGDELPTEDSWLTQRAERTRREERVVDLLNKLFHSPNLSVHLESDVLEDIRAAPIAISQTGAILLRHDWKSRSNDKGMVLFRSLPGDAVYRWGTSEAALIKGMAPPFEVPPVQANEAGHLVRDIEVAENISGPIPLRPRECRSILVECWGWGSVSGTVVDAPHKTERLPFIVILGMSETSSGTARLLRVKRELTTTADQDGAFRFERVGEGTKLLRALWFDEISASYKVVAQTLDVVSGEHHDLGMIDIRSSHEMRGIVSLVDTSGRQIEVADYFETNNLFADLIVSGRGADRRDMCASTLTQLRTPVGQEFRIIGMSEGTGAMTLVERIGGWDSTIGNCLIDVPSREVEFSLPSAERVDLEVRVSAMLHCEVVLRSADSDEESYLNLLLYDVDAGRATIAKLGTMRVGETRQIKAQPGRYAVIATSHCFRRRDPNLRDENSSARHGTYDWQEVFLGDEAPGLIEITLKKGALAEFKCDGPTVDEDGFPLLIVAAPSDFSQGGKEVWTLHRAFADHTGTIVLEGLLPNTEYTLRGGQRFRTGDAGSVVRVSL